jgi:peroxiredoxin
MLEESFVRALAMRAPLETRLAAYNEQERALAPAYAGAVDALVARLIASGAGSAAPLPGQPMPPFRLPDQNGRMVELEGLLRQGPALVVFHRGHWCPYCRISTAALAGAQLEIAGVGGRIVSITPERPIHATAMREAAGAGFPVLMDRGNGYAMSLGLVFWLGEALERMLTAFGDDVPSYQETPSWLLPIPATFVVDKSGIVVARSVDPDFRRRMATEAITEALRTLR